MSRTPAALKKTYNAVVTARVVARDQLALLTTTARPTRREVSMHTVAFTVLACIAYDDVLEPIHTAGVTVPSRAGDDEKAIVRRAAKAHGGVVGRAWWEYDATAGTTELADVVLEWAGKLPVSVPLSAYTGLAIVPDGDDLYEVLYDGDDYDA